MPDFQEFSITRTANQNLNVPTWAISLKVTDSMTGAVLFDRTGGNSFSFPQILGQLTSTQQDEFVDLIVNWLIMKRLGI